MPTQTRTTDTEEIVIPVQPEAGRRWVVPLLVLLALLLALAMVVAFALIRYQMSNRAARAQVAAVVARIQASGEPITIEDLYAYRQPAGGVRDTTGLWLAALGSFHEWQMNVDGKTLPFVGPVASEDVRLRLRPDAPESLHADAVAFLEKYDATVQATLQAAKAEGECRFPVDFEGGVTAQIPHVQGLRTLARVILLRLNVQKASGDIEGALESLETLYAIPKTINYESMLVGHMVQVAISSMAHQETAALLSDVELSGAQLLRLEGLVRSGDLQAGLTTGLIGERAMNYYTFHHLETIQSELPLNMASNGKLTRPADCALSLELMSATIDASRDPFPAALDGVEGVNSRIKGIVGSGNLLDKWNYMITALMMPAVGSGFEATATGLARQRAVQAAIAAQRYRLSTGAFPKRLSDLVPGYLAVVPIDPFDGQPLRSIERPGVLVIYSVSRNKIDDGGVENQQPAPYPADIVVRVRAVKGAEERQEDGNEATAGVPAKE